MTEAQAARKLARIAEKAAALAEEAARVLEGLPWIARTVNTSRVADGAGRIEVGAKLIRQSVKTGEPT